MLISIRLKLFIFLFIFSCIFFHPSFHLNGELHALSPDSASQEPVTAQDPKYAIEKLGKLKFTQDIPIRYLSRKQFQKYVDAMVDADYTDDAAYKDALMMRLFGFSDKILDIKGLRKKILGNGSGGLYDEKSGEVLALEDYRSTDMMRAMVVAHGLRRGLQELHFNLSGSSARGIPYLLDDRRLALQAASDGDAAFLMITFNRFEPEPMAMTMSSSPLLSLSPLGNTSQLNNAPEIVKQQLVMPYIQGMRFVIEVYKRKKKWRSVNKIFQIPPQSSEQILHPEKYLKKEAPVRVVIDYHPEGYNLYHSGVLGEYYLNLLLRKKHAFLPTTGAGWGGDTYHLFRKGETSYVLAWKSQWDEPQYCATIMVDLKKFIEKTFKVNFRKGNVKGALFIAGQSGDGRHYFFIRRFDNRMIFVRTNDKDQMNKFIFGGNYD